MEFLVTELVDPKTLVTSGILLIVLCPAVPQECQGKSTTSIVVLAINNMVEQKVIQLQVEILALQMAYILIKGLCMHVPA